MSDLSIPTLSFSLDKDATDIIVRIFEDTGDNFKLASQGLVFEWPGSCWLGSPTPWKGEIINIAFDPRDRGVYARFSFDLSDLVAKRQFDPSAVKTWDKLDHPYGVSWVEKIYPTGLGAGVMYLGQFIKYRVQDAFVVKELDDIVAGLVLDFS